MNEQTNKHVELQPGADQFTRQALVLVELKQSTAAFRLQKLQFGPSPLSGDLPYTPHPPPAKGPCTWYVKPLGLLVGKSCFLALFSSGRNCP